MTLTFLDETFGGVFIHTRCGCVRLFATPWTVARQAPLSLGFSRQESWNGLPFPSPGDLPDPGSNPGLLHCRQILFHLSYISRITKLNF